MSKLLMPLLATLILGSCTGETIEHQKIKLNDQWTFSSDDHEAQTVSLPHTPQIEPLIVNDQWQGEMTYTKMISVDQPDQGKTHLHFEGVMHTSKVYVNDQLAKKHYGGYLPFSIDVSDYLEIGENEIRVEVSNLDDPTVPPGKPLSGLDFNFYGGIYRDVWLVRKNDIYISDPFIEDIPESGVLIHFDDISPSLAKGHIRVHLRNDTDQKQSILLMGSLSDELVLPEREFFINPQSEVTVKLLVEVENPNLWSTLDPFLYDLKIDVYADDAIVDQFNDKVGIRKIELKDDGFYLNNEKQYLRGTNRHQEYPYVGYAISNEANYRDALKIKNAGFDFVRLSHYPQDEAFLDACDELGILVMNAIPGWQHFEEGTFAENSLQDVRDMVRRDRNHPSVVFWEVSVNESNMSESYMIEANRILKEELPYKDTYTAGWIDHPSYDLFIPARQHAKPPNYWNDYKNGERNIFIAEYGDWEYYAQNAGFNQTAYADLTDEERNSRQLRGAGEKRLLQQAFNFQEAANSNRKGQNSGTIGHANWVMFDYNRGYADDLEASGIADIFRIPKFAYHFYRSQRPPEELVSHPLVDDGPMVKITSYWTEKSEIPVTVFSNCEEVALFLNGRLIERKRPSRDDFSDHLAHPSFKFTLEAFEAGELLALGLINGDTVASDTVITPGKAASLKLSVDRLENSVSSDEDIFFVYAAVVDKNGTILPYDSTLVTFSTTSGELIGANPVRAEAGIASVLYKGNPVELDLKAEANGLQSASLK